MVLVRSRESSTTQIDSENSLSPLGHFTEHLVGVFEKLPPENNLDHESSSFSIRWLNSTPVIQPATNHNQHEQQSLPRTEALALPKYEASSKPGNSVDSSSGWAHPVDLGETGTHSGEQHRDEQQQFTKSK
jgi:hypothetical protein